MNVTTREAFEEALPHLWDSHLLMVDLETTGLHAFTWNKPDRLCGVAVWTEDQQGYYFPFRHLEGPNLPLEWLPRLREALCHPGVVWWGYNTKFDVEFLAVEGWPVRDNFADVMIGVHLLNENEPSFELKVLGAKYIDPLANAEQEALRQAIRKAGLANKDNKHGKKDKGGGKGNMWMLPSSTVAPYAVQDVRLTWQLGSLVVNYLRQHELYDLWWEMNHYLYIITLLELRGMLLDVPLIERYIEEANQQAEVSLAQIVEMAGYPINLKSAKQVNAWLGLPSSAADYLELLGVDAPLGVEPLQSYRAWTRAVSNYYLPFLELRGPDDVLHPNFRVVGTKTTRLSCSDPPLQAIPRYRTEYKVKDVFIARPGYRLLSLDYSQAEMRIAAHYAHEVRMQAILREGADMHGVTAARLGIPRDAAKRINFGVIYGIGAVALAEQLFIAQPKAREYLTAYHAEYPGFRKLSKRAEAIAKERGYIRLFSGRRRHYNHPVMAPPHKAMSNLIQGTVGEVVRLAMTRIHDQFASADVHMLLQIHDDVIMEVPEDRLTELVPAIRAVMEDFPMFEVPLITDPKTGCAWGKMEKWKNDQPA